MDALISFSGFLIAFVLGVAISILCVIQQLTILVFAIPYTVALNRQGALKTYAPIAYYGLSFLLLLTILSVVTWIVWRYFSASFLAYLGGAAIPIVLGAKNVGATRDNREDYLQRHARHLDTGWPNTVVAAFGEVLERANPGSLAVADVKSLPYPKGHIKSAILQVLLATPDGQLREHLKTAYISLARWQPDVGPAIQGITLESLTLTKEKSLDTLADELGPRGAEFEKWQPTVKAEQDALVADLRSLGCWDKR